MFSPYYAWARRRGAGDPADHCAFNVALYGARGKRWALTERGRTAVRRDGGSLVIGPSALAWDGTTLTARLDEVTVPLPSRIRGRVRLRPEALVADTFSLDADGRHHWRPIAPCARVEVDLERPALCWRGRAYLDSNWGDEPLEAAFSDWHWSRGSLQDGTTAILYDVTRRAGPPWSLALRCGPDGDVRPFDAPPLASLPPTVWRLGRATRSDPDTPARVLQNFEDTPFYARTLIRTGLLGESVTSVHESLSLDRFRTSWVQSLLPFRMPRRRTGGIGTDRDFSGASVNFF